MDTKEPAEQVRESRVKVLHWSSPRLNQPAVIALHLSTDAALWIAENLPLGDRATLELFSAIAETSPPESQSGCRE